MVGQFELARKRPQHQPMVEVLDFLVLCLGTFDDQHIWLMRDRKLVFSETGDREHNAVGVFGELGDIVGLVASAPPSTHLLCWHFRWRKRMTMTRQDVVSVLGQVDDVTIAEIIASGASLEELREAWGWAFGDEALMSQGRPLPGTRVAALIDLIEPDDESDAEDPAQEHPGGSR